MIIQKIEIEAFAGLKDFSLEFDANLNCIYGPNEAGKSTIQNFILAMFYGLGDRRAKDNFRDRVKPKSGEKISGRVIFSHAGKEYDLQRSFAERTALDETRIFDRRNNNIIELKDPSKPGKELFDMEEEVFKNTLFVDAEEGPKILNNGDLRNTLWSKLLDFLVNPDNDIKVGEVQNNLETGKINLRSKNGRKGLIPELETELSQLRQEKYSIESKLATQTDEISKLELYEEDLIELENKANQINRVIRIQKLAEKKETLRFINLPKLALMEREAEADLLLQKLSRFSSSNSNSNPEEINLNTGLDECGDINSNMETLRLEQDRLVNSLNNYEARILETRNTTHNEVPYMKKATKFWFILYRVSILAIVVLSLILLIFRDSIAILGQIGVGLLVLALVMVIFKSRVFDEDTNKDTSKITSPDNSREVLRTHRINVQENLEKYKSLVRKFNLNWEILGVELGSSKEDYDLKSDSVSQGSTKEDKIKGDSVKAGSVKEDKSKDKRVKDNSTNEDSENAISRELAIIRSIMRYLNSESNKLKIYEEQANDLAFLTKDISRLQSEIMNSNYTESDIENLESNIESESIELSVDKRSLSKPNLAELYAFEKEFDQVNEAINTKESIITELKQNLKILSVDPSNTEDLSLQSRSFKIQELIEEKQEKLEDLIQKYQAFELAEENLSESLLEFRQVLLPELGARAGKYMELISSGSYKNVRVNDQLFANLENKGFGTLVAENKLSSGTVDQLYLAYRLALIDYICKDEEFTLLLDDPFVYFDEERLLASLRLLEKYSERQNKQIILFTCHKHICDRLIGRAGWEIQFL